LSAPDELLGKSPEVLLVTMARRGNRDAFAELVRRREAWIRALMLRCCNDFTLAEDLAQQAFVQAWQTIGQLRQASRFGAWLKRLAVNTWLQYVRKNDPLRETRDEAHADKAKEDTAGISMDLDRALATLKEPVRLCIVMSYHEGMTHDEIADFTGLPVGTVKSHIRRGTQRLQQELEEYLA
jgi:RNA polymerase sigma factor (sigma-70 family)